MENWKELIKKVWNRQPIFFTSASVLIPLYFLTGSIHEFGHIVICVSNGFDYTLTWKNFALNTYCSSTPNNVLLYFALGGIFGMIASLLLFLSNKIRTNKGIFVGVSVVAFDHFLKAIFETYTHTAYLYNFGFKMYLGVILALFWFGLLIFFIQRAKKKT